MKIALVGTGAQWPQAPYNDPSCEIWVTGGLWEQAPRIDRYWEIHGTKTIDEVYAKNPKWLEFVKGLGSKFICKEPDIRWPEATVFDFEDIMLEFGTFFTSSIAWMMAAAMRENPEVISLWGVNAAHGTEYAYQKPSLCYMAGIAAGKDIQVQVLDTSEIFKVPWIYAYQEQPAILKAMGEKKRQMKEKLEQQEHMALLTARNKGFCEGSIEMIDHFSNNFGGVE